jgi:V8-like Glu-specific endopeptidase
MTATRAAGGGGAGSWVRRELGGAAITPPPGDPLWTPLDTAMNSRGYMAETHGGGRIEGVPGMNRRRALTAGLPAGQPETRPGMVPQSAADHVDLTPVLDTTSIPWRSICQLLITRQNGVKEYGTAWFAGPALLVTAGHCIVDHKGGGWASSIAVVPGSNGSYPPPFSIWQAAGIEAHEAWAHNADPRFDYGFIALAETSIGQQLGWFGFSVLPDDKVKTLLVNIGGYPVDKPAGTMWCNSGRIVDADGAFLAYMLETKAGESGGPVFWYGGDQRVVVAVHAYQTGIDNKGLRVTAEMYHRITDLRGF